MPKDFSYSCSTVLGLCGNRNEFQILKEVVHARWGMKHETKIALSDDKNKRCVGGVLALICLYSAGWVLVYCLVSLRLSAGLLLVCCR